MHDLERMVARALTTNPLHPLFAAEMHGADLRAPPPQELVAAVEAAMDRYAVLVIRGQHIDDEQHIRFSRAFGPLELPPDLGIRNVKRRLRRELYDASNLDAEGNLLELDSTRRNYNRANEIFHTDSSFNDLPTKWSLLLAHVLPPEGGDTQFVDTRAVYDDLTPAMKEKIENLVAEHFLYNEWSRGGFIKVTDEMRRRMPPVQHPLVRQLPYGRKALYIGAHASHIVGWPIDEGRDLLQELYDFATQDKYIYSHRWRQGDLVIWDNRCTMHRAAPFDDSMRHVRDLRRTTVNEYGPECASTDPVPA
jgi:alpha-ketoglutarate-dependent 2,4-dichlorophenoxyacetate dioxygenase